MALEALKENEISGNILRGGVFLACLSAVLARTVSHDDNVGKNSHLRLRCQFWVTAVRVEAVSGGLADVSVEK